MRVHQAVAALRRDPSSQRRSRAHMEAALGRWLEVEREVGTALQTYDQSGDLRDGGALRELMGNAARAREFVDRYIALMAQAQREEPLGEMATRHSSSAGFARMQLMQSGGSVLSLCVYEPVADPRPAPTTRFVDCSLHEMIVAGSVRGRFHQLEGESASITTRDEHWRAGSAICCKALCEAREFVEVQQSVLALQLSRTPMRAKASREYRLDDALLVQQVSGDKHASEHVMALGVLGALKDREAIAGMEGFACNRGNDPDARWEAVRQTLAMDTARGLELLTRFSGDDPLARPAQELRAHLIASHPAIRERVSEDG